jgi:hypothetical protein
MFKMGTRHSLQKHLSRFYVTVGICLVCGSDLNDPIISPRGRRQLAEPRHMLLEYIYQARKVSGNLHLFQLCLYF